MENLNFIDLIIEKEKTRGDVFFRKNHPYFVELHNEENKIIFKNRHYEILYTETFSDEKYKIAIKNIEKCKKEILGEDIQIYESFTRIVFYQDKTFPYKYNSDKSYVELNKKFFNDYINNLYTICEATFCVNKIFNRILNKEN